MAHKSRAWPVAETTKGYSISASAVVRISADAGTSGSMRLSVRVMLWLELASQWSANIQYNRAEEGRTEGRTEGGMEGRTEGRAGGRARARARARVRAGRGSGRRAGMCCAIPVPQTFTSQSVRALALVCCTLTYDASVLHNTVCMAVELLSLPHFEVPAKTSAPDRRSEQQSARFHTCKDGRSSVMQDARANSSTTCTLATFFTVPKSSLHQPSSVSDVCVHDLLRYL